MNLNRVDMILDYRPGSNSQSKVLIDGVELKGIRSIEVSAAHDAVTEVVVRFAACVNCDPEQPE
jgi:hypothetical protein